MRDPDGWTYFKEEVGGLVVGGFEPEAKPWRSPDDLPHPFEFQLLEEDWEHFSVLMDEALLRVPALAETGIRKFYNGPESFTPDNQFLLGPRPRARQRTSSAPASTRWASPPPAARAARWPSGSWRASRPADLVGVDVRRFAPFHGDTGVAAGPGRGGARACTTPCRGRTARSATARDVRLLAAARPAGRRRGGVRLEDGLGAGQRLRAAPGADLDVLLGQAVLAALVGGRAAGLPDRRRGLRPDVVLEVRRAGPGRARRRCSGSARPTSTSRSAACVYTPFLNERGTYEADLTVTRTGEDAFLVLSSSATTVRDLDWLRAARRRSTRRDVTEDVRGARRDGARRRASCSGGSATPTCPRTGSRSRPAARSRWPARPCGRPG